MIANLCMQCKGLWTVLFVATSFQHVSSIGINEVVQDNSHAFSEFDPTFSVCNSSSPLKQTTQCCYSNENITSCSDGNPYGSCNCLAAHDFCKWTMNPLQNQNSCFFYITVSKTTGSTTVILPDKNVGMERGDVLHTCYYSKSASDKEKEMLMVERFGEMSCHVLQQWPPQVIVNHNEKLKVDSISGITAVFDVRLMVVNASKPTSFIDPSLLASGSDEEVFIITNEREVLSNNLAVIVKETEILQWLCAGLSVSLAITTIINCIIYRKTILRFLKKERQATTVTDEYGAISKETRKGRKQSRPFIRNSLLDNDLQPVKTPPSYEERKLSLNQKLTTESENSKERQKSSVKGKEEAANNKLRLMTANGSSIDYINNKPIHTKQRRATLGPAYINFNKVANGRKKKRRATLKVLKTSLSIDNNLRVNTEKEGTDKDRTKGHISKRKDTLKQVEEVVID